MTADDFKLLMKGCHTVTDLEALSTRWHEIKAQYPDLVALRQAFVAHHEALDAGSVPEPDRGDSSRAVKTVHEFA